MLRICGRKLRRSIRATAAAPGSSRGPGARRGSGDLFRIAPASPGSPGSGEALKRPGRSRRTRQEVQGGTQEAGKPRTLGHNRRRRRSIQGHGSGRGAPEDREPRGRGGSRSGSAAAAPEEGQTGRAGPGLNCSEPRKITGNFFGKRKLQK